MQKDCETYLRKVRYLMRREPSQPFFPDTPGGFRQYFGLWIGSSCWLSEGGGSQTFPVPVKYEGGTFTVHRIIVAVLERGTAQQAKVIAEWVPR